jgi:bacterioferritin
MSQITKVQLVDLLNKDLALEWSAAVQYIQHAAMLTGAQYQAVQKELLIHANEEIMHSVQLSDVITTLGGVVTTEVAERHSDADSTKMLEQDLAGELDAIARYKERIGQAHALGEYGIAKVLTDILAMEEEHARDIGTALGK